MEIKINCHSSICVNGKIWFDPFRVECVDVTAKLIFITHPHWDHFSVEDIKKILSRDTKIICPSSMKKDIENVFENEIIYVEPENTYDVDGIKFDTFYSYNIEKQFHPKENAWLGYNVLIDGENVAVVGDSDNTPELNSLKTDILLLPIGGTYTMNILEAVELAKNIKPKKVIPTHYGEIVGEETAGLDFKKMIDGDIVCELKI